MGILFGILGKKTQEINGRNPFQCTLAAFSVETELTYQKPQSSELVFYLYFI
jgi:hypothetical protein